MADIELKSITFPGLPNKYIVPEAPEVDTTLSIAGKAADAKATGDAVDELKSALASALPTASASGAVASFTDGANNIPVDDLKISIEPKQEGSGDPSPSNVRAISGWTEVNITRAGKNILDQSWTFGNIDNTGADSDTSKYYIRSASYVRVQPSTTYNYIYQGTEGALQIYGVFYDNEMNVIQRSAIKVFSSVTTSATFTATTPNTAAWLRVFFYKTPAYTSASGELLCLSVDALEEYEPYTAQTYPISFGSAGTVYGGTLDVTTGVLTVDRAMLINLASLSGWFTSNGNFGIDLTSIGCATFTANESSVVSSKYKTMPAKSSTSTYNSDDLLIFGYTDKKWVVFRDSQYATLDAFKTSLGDDTQLVIKLATPQTYQLTPTEVRTLLGNNNIWADTGDSTVEYRADTTRYIDRRINAQQKLISGVETSYTATKNYAIGDYVIVNDTLYKVTAAIATGATIAPGTNVVATTVAEQLILLANA